VIPVRARVEPSLAAHVVRRTPLLYTGGADASLDRPAHVRAGSALVRLARGKMAVVQDDASFVAVVDPETGAVVDLPLPSSDGVRQFDELRGNKAAKLDLEASVAVGHALFAFGSGSSPLRERVVVVRGIGTGAESVAIVRARDLYARWRADRTFSGSELNVEGAAIADDDVVLFQRGNGAGEAVDATARIDARALAHHLLALSRGEAAEPPPLRDVVQWDLGAAGGTRLTFTDGTHAPRGRIAFLACAEASPDATRDGPVSGVAIGRLDDRARVCEIAFVTDERGAPLLDKAEGLALDPGGRRAFAVVDKDDPRCPSELLELALGEGWRA
jgi:hypothetical protein